MDKYQKLVDILGILEDYMDHKNDCILTFFEAGEPTKDGGYRVKYKGVWFLKKPIDNSPKCDCGFDGIWNEYQKALNV